MESTIERVARYADRRTLLKRGSAGAVGAVLAAAALVPGRSGAYGIHNDPSHGCTLCRSPSSCNPVCVWCWWGDCHTNVGGSSHHQTLCCEGYRNYAGCSGGCTSSIQCSWYGSNRPC
jgi:hypothetical protein